jgi:hypothetical protein
MTLLQIWVCAALGNISSPSECILADTAAVNMVQPKNGSLDNADNSDNANASWVTLSSSSSQIPLSDAAAQAQSIRLITGHTAATLPQGTFELAIQHRFGELGSGAYQLYGLDNFNSMRIGFDYGLRHRITVGVGRSSNRKTYNSYVKWRILGNADGAFNLTYLADIAVDGRRQADWGLESLNPMHRLYYTHQCIASWQANKHLVIALTPTIIHANLVSKTQYSNDIPLLAWYVRQRVIPKLAFTAEGSFILDQIRTVQPKNKSTLGLGFEYFTPLHVFQINITNSRALNEPYFMLDPVSSYSLKNFCLGFNLIRRW